MPKHLLFLILCCLVLVTACGSDDEEAGLQSSNQDSSEAPTATPPPATSSLSELPVPEPADTLRLPALDDMPGQIYVIGGGERRVGLWRVDFDGEAATQVQDDVNQYSAMLAPGGARFGLSGRREESPRNAAWIIDAEGVQAEMGLNSAGLIGAWSPDGTQALVWESRGTQLLHMDGSTRSLLGVGLADVAWTTEGDILLGMFNPQTGDLGAVLRYDEPEPELLIEDRSQDWAFLLDVPLGDYTLAPGYRFFDRARLLPDGNAVRIPIPPDRSATQLCDTWTVYYGPPGATAPLLALEDTHTVATGPALPDGALVIERYFKPTCTISERVQIEVLRVTADGASAVLLEPFAIDATTIQGLFERYHPYALSPDGRYVVWIDGVASTTSLHLKEVASGAEATLAIVPGMGGVLWVSN